MNSDNSSGMTFQIMYGVYWSLSFPGEKKAGGGKARDNRLFINAVFRILRTGAPCELFRRSTATGKILIAVFVVGVTMEYGKKSCLI